MKIIDANASALPPQRLSHMQVLAFGSPMLPLAIGFSILIMFIPTYYGLTLGLGLGLVGVILAAGRIFDFVTDPLIGVLSDRTRSRFGARKPWICIGLCLFSLATCLLFLPSQNVNPIYLFLAACLYFLSFTISEIPLAALGLEISSDKNERTRLAASKTVFFIIGGIIGAAIPAIWKADLTQAFGVAVTAISVSTLIILPVFLILTPNGPRDLKKDQRPLFRIYKAVLSNRNIGRIMSVFFVSMIATSISGSLSLLYVSYILLNPELIGLVWMASGVGILCGLAVWYILSKRLGKLTSWRLAIALSVVFGLPLLILGEGDEGLMISISFALGFCGACEAIMPVSLLADHVSEQQAKGKSGQAGGITGLKNATSKLSIVVPLLIAFPILSAIGLDRNTPDIVMASLELTGSQSLILTGLYAGVPLLLRVFAYILMGRFWNSAEFNTL